MKVYCINCKFLHFNFLDNDIVSCEVKHEWSKVVDPVHGTHYIKVPVTQYHPSNRNRDFDCEYYKRIWWKFWVKEK